MKKNFITYLNEVCKELDIKYDINYGGCCYVASVIAKELEDRNIPFLYVEIYGHYHCTLKVGRQLINPMGCKMKNGIEYNRSSNEIEDEYRSNDWNDMYNRRWNLIVKTIIHSKFKEYDNNRDRFYIKT